MTNVPNIPTRHRSYASARREQLEPLSFDIDGEVFQCVPQAPIGVMLDFARLQDAEGNMTLTSGMIWEFFEGILLRNDAEASNNGTPPRGSSFERFAAILHDQDRIVDEKVLAEIVKNMMEDYSGRPTQAPSPSPS